jgi:O-antigen ligase
LGPIVTWATVSIPVIILYCACLAGGANEAGPALALCAAGAAMTLACLVSRHARERLRRLRLPRVCLIGFGSTLLIALWTLTPWVPGGAHPVWEYVGGPGASTIDRARTTVELFKLLGLACFFLLGAISGSHENASGAARLSVLWLGAGLAIIGLVRLATFGGRMDAALPSPNIAGALFAALALLALPLLGRLPTSGPLVRTNKLEQVITAYAPGFSLLALFSACLVLTASRGATLCALAAVLIYLGLYLSTRRTKVRLAMLAAIATILLVSALIATKGEAVVQRLSDPTPLTDFGGRVPILVRHTDAFLRSPLFGYGLGSFDSVNKLFLDGPSYASLWMVRSAHNVYLQWLEEAGILGAAPMFAAIGAILLAVLTRLRRVSRSRSWIAALLAVDSFFLIHGAIDFELEVPAVAALWAYLLGLQLGMVSPASDRR